MTRLLFLVLGIIWAPALQAQSATVIRYAEEEGLARTDVQTLLTDRRGMTWVGTRGAGLYQFNYGRFHQDPDMLRLLGYHIYGLTEGGDGMLYVWSDAGIHTFDGGSWRAAIPADQDITGVMVCADSFWIAGQHGLAYGLARARILEVPISCMTCTELDELIAVGQDSLWVIAGDRILSYPLPAGGTPWQALTTADASVWLGNAEGTLLRFDAGSIARYETGLTIHALLASGTGQVLIGAENGLHVFTGDD
ncbi:MAG: hypothetical protein R3330_08165, partial [Saprospiraceae bacterium]|nr:hypothetical protein [Saprospiraceae bacterium]